MEIWLVALIIVSAAALSAAGMLIVRQRAPRGKFFKDPVPLGAVYSVAGTAYMVIVAFVFFIAFETYGGAKDDALVRDPQHLVEQLRQFLHGFMLSQVTPLKSSNRKD